MKKSWLVAVLAVIVVVVGYFTFFNSTTSPRGTASEPVAGKHRVLVAYYSASGHTADVAKNIASTLGADTFVITPKNPYTAADLNYRDENSRVVKEHNDPTLQDRGALVQVTPNNWKDYDVVLVGYPIWWGIAAWPVNQFVSGNDFSGKTVIPFATSISSGFGESGDLLAKRAGTGNWKEGHRFVSNATADDVRNWAQSLSL